MRWIVAAMCVALTGCGDPAPGTAPLEALPACTEPPAAVAEPPEGFIAPEQAVILQVTPQRPIVQVTAYLPMTPVRARLAYEELDDIKVLISEDEVFEAELLVSNGGYRTYVRATATCREGSHLLAVVAPESAASALPTPAGTPSPVPLPTP